MKKRKKAFWHLINSYVQENDCSHSKAVKELKQFFPDLENVTQAQVDEFLKSTKKETKHNGNKPGEFKDYMALCREYRGKNQCSLIEAMRAIDRLVPQAREQYIEKVNRERETQRAPQTLAKADGRTFPEMVEQLKLEHKMTTSQAHTYIDRRWPGLRQHYIDQCNS